MPAERYHQVLLPVLRVAAAVAQSLDSETAKVSCCHHRAAFRLPLPQDCAAFLTGQVDAFLPILRSDTGAISLAATQETAMLVTILYQILRTRNSTVRGS